METGRNTSRGRRAKRWIAIAAGAALAGGAAAVATALPAEGHGWKAKTILRDVNGAKVGIVRFEGDRRGTEVKVTVAGVTVNKDTFHGLHIHANENAGPCDPATGFANVGGHWNPSGADHGHHHGDLPSLLIDADGRGRAESVTGRFRPRAIAGRAVILHAGPDNLANIPDRYSTGTPPVAGPDAATKATGDSGGRIACGIIVVD
jgi:Cu-Zn family superoxide dismutase